MEEILVEFVQLEPFAKQLERTDEPELLLAIEGALIKDPDAGVLLRGGIRKVRLQAPARAKGKRGGFRVWYYYYRVGQSIWLLHLLDKREGQNITKEQEKRMVIALRVALGLP